MEVKCYKTVGAKGRIYIPVSICQIAGIDKEDVVCVTGLINKAEVAAKNPIELLQSGLKREKEAMELEKNKIKNNAKKMLEEGHSLDEALEEVLYFLF